MQQVKAHTVFLPAVLWLDRKLYPWKGWMLPVTKYASWNRYNTWRFAFRLHQKQSSLCVGWIRKAKRQTLYRLRPNSKPLLECSTCALFVNIMLSVDCCQCQLNLTWRSRIQAYSHFSWARFSVENISEKTQRSLGVLLIETVDWTGKWCCCHVNAMAMLVFLWITQKWKTLNRI